MATTGFILPPSLSFSQPSEQMLGEKKFVSFSPSGQQSYSPGDTIKIQVSSSNQFMDPSRSYFRFRVRGTGTSNANHAIPFSGWSYLINRISTHVSGLQVEDISNYNTYVSSIYRAMPSEYQNVLTKLEDFGVQTGTVPLANADGLTNGKIICHAPRIAILESAKKMIPLPFIKGNVEFNFYLEQFQNFMQTNASGQLTGLIIDQIAFVACMITPSPSYLEAFQSSLDGGSVVKLPLSCVKTIRNAPVNASESSELLNVGFLRSLKKVDQLIQSNVQGITSATSGNDSSRNFTLNGVSGYGLSIDSQNYPSNFMISTNTAVAAGPVSTENLMQKLCSVDNTYGFMNSEAGLTSGNHLTYDLSHQGAFGSGVPVANGVVSINKRGTPTSTAVIQTNVIEYDALLKISSSSVELDTQQLS